MYLTLRACKLLQRVCQCVVLMCITCMRCVCACATHACISYVCVCFAAGVYRKFVMEELFQPDRDVHVCFRVIGRKVFLATNGNQSPVWRSYLAHWLVLNICESWVVIYYPKGGCLKPYLSPKLALQMSLCEFFVENVIELNSLLRSLHRHSHRAHRQAHILTFFLSF